MARPSVAHIDLGALRGNVGVVRDLAPESRLLAVVKANAYGHGAVAVAAALEPVVDALAVACLEEAVELREVGISAPILLLEGIFEAAELAEAVARDLWLTVASTHQLAQLETARLPSPLQCWLKVNTGMNRLGVPLELAADCYRRLGACPNTRGDVVLYTHLASADSLHSDATARQLAAFDGIAVDAQRSAANSAGVLAWPASHYDWVRPGYMLYGNSPLDAAHPNTAALRPVMTLASRVISLCDVEAGAAVGYGGTWVARRRARIATVAIGYGDGYPRHAPNGTPVLVNGRRAPLAGRVSMDMITVDVSGVPDVAEGTGVVLWGEGLPVDEVARSAGTIGYELTTRMTGRTPRISRDGD